MKTFGDFVADQVARGESLPAIQGYIYSEAAQTEIADFFEARAGERYDAARQSTLQWLQDSSAAQKVKAVMDEAMQGDQAPTISSIRETWNRMHGAHKPINYDCSECGGSGWAEITAGSVSGATRCKRGCAVPPDRVQYAAVCGEVDSEENSRMAEEFGRELAARLAKPIVPKELPPLKNPITESDLKNVPKWDGNVFRND